MVATYSSKENLLRGYCNFQHLCTKHKGPQFIKETLLHLKSYSDSHTVIVDGVINTPLSPTERSSRLTPNREMMQLPGIISHMDQRVTNNPNTRDHTFFPATLNRHRKKETTPCVLSDHCDLELDIKNNRKLINLRKLNNSIRNEK